MTLDGVQHAAISDRLSAPNVVDLTCWRIPIIPVRWRSAVTALEPDLDVSTIRLIHAIDTRGSLTRAAQYLGVSQPAITQRLQRAEARLGVALTQRVGRGVVLTAAGRIIAHRAAEIIASVESVLAEVGQVAARQRNQIKIAAFESAALTIVPSLMAWAGEHLPDLSISYVSADLDAALTLIRDGEVDAGIVTSHEGVLTELAGPPTGVAMTRLTLDEVYVAMPRDHPLAEQPAVDAKALEDDVWITTSCARCRKNLVTLCSHAGYSPHLGAQMHSPRAALSLVANGAGISLVPGLSLRASLIPARVVARPFEPSFKREIVLVSREADDTIPHAVLNAIRVIARNVAHGPLRRPIVERGRDVA